MIFASLSRRILGVTVAAAVTLATMAPASARPYRHHHYGRHNGAVAGALALGALGVGLAIANSHRHRHYYDDAYEGDYYYGGPAPRRWGGYHRGWGEGRHYYGGRGYAHGGIGVPLYRNQGIRGGDH